MDLQEQLAEQLQNVRDQIVDACRLAGRNPSEVELLAVSKHASSEQLIAAFIAGQRSFGESRAQELSRKQVALADYLASHPCSEELASSVCFDMIGNLQTNKINQILGHIRYIHSVNSLHLARAINQRAHQKDCCQKILLEVNVVGESTKAGMPLEEVDTFFERFMELQQLELCGLMAMAPANDPSAARRSFSGLRELRERLQQTWGMTLPVLSCGMSGDFKIAVEEGSTLLRLGTAIFGAPAQR